MRSKRGFSIIEALIALFLVGIALSGTVSVMITGASYVKATTHRIIAQGVAQGEIGKLRVYGFSAANAMQGEMQTAIILDEGDPEDPEDALDAVLIRTVQPLDMDGDGSTDLLRLEIQVHWDEFGRAYQQRSTSFLTKRSF